MLSDIMSGFPRPAARAWPAPWPLPALPAAPPVWTLPTAPSHSSPMPSYTCFDVTRAGAPR
jgi:hypothetical protein